VQPNYTAFRLELTFVPIAAAGLALAGVALLRAPRPAFLDTNVLRFGGGRSEHRPGGGAQRLVAAHAPLRGAARPRRSAPHAGLVSGLRAPRAEPAPLARRAAAALRPGTLRSRLRRPAQAGA